jgi:hypothetical protein
MIGNFTQRREHLQAHVLSLHSNEQAAGPSSAKAGSRPAYEDLSLRLGIALVTNLF